MDPNKTLAGVLAGIGFVALIIILGVSGLIPFLESPMADGEVNGSVEPVKSPEPTQPAPAPSTPTSQPTPSPVPAPVEKPAPSPSTPPVESPAPATPPLVITTTPAEEPSAPIVTPPAPKPATLPVERKPRGGLPELGYYTFDKAENGAIPSGWSILRGEWEVNEDKRALSGTGKNVFHQYAIPKESQDAIVISNDSVFKNLLAGVNVLVTTTRSNQTAGVVFRYQDPGHYYSVGLDTKTQRVVLFKTIAGITRVLAFAPTNRIKPNEWHYIEISATGAHLKVRLNEDSYISIKDESFTDGKTGLWTMGSTDARFDNAEFRKLP